MNLPSFTTDFNEKYLNVFVDRALIAYASREMTNTICFLTEAELCNIGVLQVKSLQVQYQILFDL